MDQQSNISGIAVALGIGLLVGMERERRKGQGQGRAAQGLRTFALVALLGNLSIRLGGTSLLAVVFIGITALAVGAYWRKAANDPGITSQVALMAVLLLGAWCQTAPALAGGVGVVVVVLLAFRDRLHRLVLQQLGERELRDGLILLAAALVVLPLAPDLFMGPFRVFNPYTLCTLVVLLMAASALGHCCVRILGARYGYALGAIAAGFASSTATVAAMGARARNEPAQARALAAAGLLSNLATVVQAGLMLAVVSLDVLTALWPCLLAGGLGAGLWGIGLMLASPASRQQGDVVGGAVFDVKKILIVSALISSITLMCAALSSWFGHRGLMVGTLLGGFADAHAPIASIGSLMLAGELPATQVPQLVLAALSSNSLSKCLLATSAGGARYAGYFIPGQVAMLAAMWLVFGAMGAWPGGVRVTLQSLGAG